MDFGGEGKSARGAGAGGHGLLQMPCERWW